MSDSLRNLLRVHNGQAFDTAACPVIAVAAWRQTILAAVADGAKIASLFGHPVGPAVRLTCVLAFDASAELGIVSTNAPASYPALTPDCPQAHWFEREIYEQWDVLPQGHPWLKPIRFQPPRCPSDRPRPAIGIANFFRIQGDEVHEVAVGPVHAGVIEPGHFRFQCLGETVHHLEISLGYQHRGVERALMNGSDARRIHYIETLAGDTTIGHATAYAHAIEALADIRVPARGQVIRSIAAELERLANHIGDLGAISGDVGFLPTSSYCGRIRGDALNLTALLCGNRFGRGLIVPGGCVWDIEPQRAEELRQRLAAIATDVASALELMFETPSVLARFENTGTLTTDMAHLLGLVGPVARACGLERDIRTQHPYGFYRFASVPVSTWHSGDCFARAYVRRLEIQRSLAFIDDQLQALPIGPTWQCTIDSLPANGMVVTLVEGWRGEICHTAMTDEAGRCAFYKIVDPSFHNWFGLAMSMRNQQISDFPLCNKSYNLSYCGHDL